MNSWQRVVAAMQLSTPDRIPTYELHPSLKIFSAVLGKNTSEIMAHNPEAFFNLVASKGEVDLDKVNEQIAEELLNLYSKIGIDWIRVVKAYSKIPREVKRIGEHMWQVDGKTYLWSGETLWNLSEPETYDPDEVIRTCRNNSIEVDPLAFEVLRKLAAKVKKEMFLSFDADGTWEPIVSNPNLLKHVLLWIHRRPDAVEALINHNTDLAIEYGRWAIDEGADAIQLCVDYGNQNGPWMSPAMFRKLVKPALRREVDAFKKKGAFTVLHSDGYIMPILSDIVDTGIDAYQCIDVMAGMKMGEVKERFGDKICLIGNVDPRIIEYGTKHDVEKEVERCLREGGREGYILSASASVALNNNVENFIHMINYVKEKTLTSSNAWW
ncbi:MAG: uroporphyrinogen decarboxylase family protein [Thermoproteota archaeon]